MQTADGEWYLGRRPARRWRACWCVLALPALLLPAGCGKRGQPPPPPPQEKEPFNAKLEAEGIHWTLPDRDGRPLWEMRANKGKGGVVSGVAQFEGVRCTVYADGQPSLHASAPRVQADVPGKRLSLSGGVSARAVDGTRTFRAEQVSLTVKEENRAVIEATGAVRLDVDGTVLTGERLVTNPRLTEGELIAR